MCSYIVIQNLGHGSSLETLANHLVLWLWREAAKEMIEALYFVF